MRTKKSAKASAQVAVLASAERKGAMCAKAVNKARRNARHGALRAVAGVSLAVASAQAFASAFWKSL